MIEYWNWCNLHRCNLHIETDWNCSIWNWRLLQSDAQFLLWWTYGESNQGIAPAGTRPLSSMTFEYGTWGNMTGMSTSFKWLSRKHEISWDLSWREHKNDHAATLISRFYQGFHGMMQCVSCWLTWLSGHQHLPKEAWVGFSHITLDSAFRKGKLQDGKVMNQNQPFTHRFSMLFAYVFGIHCHCI